MWALWSRHVQGVHTRHDVNTLHMLVPDMIPALLRPHCVFLQLLPAHHTAFLSTSCTNRECAQAQSHRHLGRAQSKH